MKNTSEEDIVRSIINVGRKCKNNGISKVAISKIVKRRSTIKVQAKINKVNDFLEDMCLEHQLDIIDNDNIIDEDISSDRLHLTYRGTCKLANNFIGYLNGFDDYSNN